MTPPDADEPFSVFLAAYDEALAAGTPADASSAPHELRPRLDRACSCLERLERDRRQTPRLAETARSQGAGTIGRFEVRGELGRGGYGIVFLAFDPLLRRDVALKVPRLEAVFDGDQRRRFLREAQSAAGLEHPNIVPVFEAGEASGVSYIASAYCSGPTLAAWLHGQRNLVAPHTAAALVAALADGVQHAHEHGILHRDLKPSNVLLQPTSADTDHLEFVPRLSDFGLAKLLEREEESTRSGALLGTPAYMAPEQAEGRSNSVGPATDVYGLGAILYELLTERPPFKGASVLETLEQVRSQAPLPPSRLHAGLPRDLETICLKCLAKDANQRYPTARALADDLRRLVAGTTIKARPPGWFRLLEIWSRQPARIREAGLYTIILHSAMLCWSLLILAALLLSPGFPARAEMRSDSEIWLRGGLIPVFLHLPCLLLGLKTLARQRWSIVVGFVFSLCLTLLALAVQLGYMTIVDLEENGARVTRFFFASLLVMLFGVQTLLYVAALRAHAALRRKQPSASGGA